MNSCEENPPVLEIKVHTRKWANVRDKGVLWLLDTPTPDPPFEVALIVQGRRWPLRYRCVSQEFYVDLAPVGRHRHRDSIFTLLKLE